MRHTTFLSTTIIAFTLQAHGARVCGNASSPSHFQWSVGDFRYDGGDPTTGTGNAILAVSITPVTTGYGTLFECVAEWPESWAGYYDGKDQRIWGDCDWTGNGGNSDETVSFSVDWKKKIMYLSHTFACTNDNSTNTLAIGQVMLSAICTTGVDGTSCTPANVTAKPTIDTTQEPPRLGSNASCEDRSKQFQSWQVVNWHRQFELVPGTSPDSEPESDTGPIFTLKSMSDSNIFDCATEQGAKNTFTGFCKSAIADSVTAVQFVFDRQTNFLQVTQSWNCLGSPPFNVTGIGFVQADCDRSGNVFVCTDDPTWLGSSTG